MPFRSWSDAVRALRARSAPASQEQHRLASFVGLKLQDGTPARVAAALLRRRLGEALNLPISTPMREHTPSYLESLADELDAHLTFVIEDHGVADAWVQTLWDRRGIRALDSLQLWEGDLVAMTGAPDEECDFVSSISADGRVNFRGGLGRGARPHRLRVVARRTDVGERVERLRESARNRAAHRQRIADVSRAMLAEIAQFKVPAAATAEDVGALEDTLDRASDERPLQALFASRPALLAVLLADGHGVYVVPHPPLAGRYVPDFFIANVDSAGIHWYMVELQSPVTNLSIREGRDYSEQVREGLAQVAEWREWLTANLHIARQGRRQLGLGLPGIRPESPGIVLVGRRHTDEDVISLRRQRTEQTDQIVIHTYDWLVESAHRTAAGVGTLPWRSVLKDELDSFEEDRLAE